MPKNKVREFPSYTHHKPSGQARVRVNGRDVYLGEYGSPASKALYKELKDEWHSKRADVSKWNCTVDDLAIRFMEHAKVYYRKNGDPTSEVNNMRVALRPLVELFGPRRVANIESAEIEQYRDHLVTLGVARTSINRQLSRIKHVFKWGKTKKLVSAATVAEVRDVSGLLFGRSNAVESIPVTPVSEVAIKAIRPFVSRQIWGLIQLQLSTGMRPGEAIIMRGCDLTMVGQTWEYRPAWHKTEHHGKSRVIFIGPRGQSVIREFLKADLSQFLFSPVDARAEFDERRRADRKSRVTPSQSSRTKKVAPKRSPGKRYTVCSYGQAVRKACEQAFGMPEDLRKITADLPEEDIERRREQASEWRRIHAWHPHQLRHTAATLLRREFGLEASRVVLGVGSAKVAEIYAEMDQSKARDVMSKIG